ncbi:ras guanine nucleotide exchange factor F-like [Thalassophryne amazonica]|uniref:ras guanine nucleotide exchange factor F-like n=1 Tax=Thalassophryne amazonica TaxID=390379 RepID=UPI001471A1D5|nr:ras guanine nucleotide exchange factor F-like [Thalassophryne amazonica]
MDWSLTDGSQQGSLGPGPRHSHSAVSYQDCMYLFGGLQGLREQRDLWRWNSTNHTWSCLKNKSGPSRLVGHSAVTYKDSMFVFGGGESQNFPKNCLWRYSFPTQTWEQVATLSGLRPPPRIHHCCTGLGPSYRPITPSSSLCTSSGLGRKLLEEKFRPFKNKCFPAPLKYLGSECNIELETFTPEKHYSGRTLTKLSGLDHIQKAVMEKGGQLVRDCLTFENKAFRTHWSCADEEDLFDDEHGDITQNLPDLLLVLGGRPCTMHTSITIWQMTLTDS